MVIKWTGKKATVKSLQGALIYTLVKIKGVNSMSLQNSNGTVIKAGFQTKEHASQWLENYLKGLK